MKKVLLVMTIGILAYAVYSISPSSKTLNIECYKTQEILVSLGKRNFMVNWKTGVFNRKKTLLDSQNESFRDQNCRFKHEVPLEVDSFILRNYIPKKKQQGYDIPYQFSSDVWEKADKPRVPSISFHFKARKGGARSLDEVHQILEERAITLDDLPEKDGFRILEREDIKGLRYYIGKIKGTDYPLIFHCGRYVNDCNGFAKIDNIYLWGNFIARADQDERWSRNLQDWSQEHRYALDEFYLREENAKRHLNIYKE